MRIHITGASGAGCTTLGRALAERLGCVNLDTDIYFWLPTDPPFQQVRDRTERQRLLGDDLRRHSAWTLSGSLVGWGDIFIPQFSLVIYLSVPPAIRRARLAAREQHRFGEAALAPGGRMHDTHARFMAWAAGYDTGDLSMRSRRLHEQWLAALPCPVLRFEGLGTVEKHLATVIDQIEHY
jgi:adenylate kinase family enzyme